MQPIVLATVVICSVGLVGCASGPPTAKELAAADYGSSITQSDAESKAKAFLRGTLKDPSSAEYDWGTVQRGYVRTAPIEGGKLIWGYKLDAQINAKNSFGGYTGFKPYVFMFKNGQLEGVWGSQEIGSGFGATSYMGRLK